MANTITYTLKFDVTDCCVCGVQFALEAGHMASLRRSGKGFYCPNGHSLTYGRSESDKLRAELDQMKADRDWQQKRAERLRRDNEDERRRHAATKGQLTKTKKRLANGVCPCCKRSFPALQRHMATEHPDYEEAK